MKRFFVLFLILTATSAQSMEQSKTITNFVWSKEGQNLPDEKKIDFVYKPGIGLTDLDFHKMSDRGWQNMKSPGNDYVAILYVGPETTTAQLQDTIQLITTKGGYQKVIVDVRKSGL